jgi:ABC-type sugar transport system ATPase subunit
VPENRKTEGLVSGMSIGDNVTLSALRRVAKGGLVNSRRQLEAAKEGLSRFTLQRPVGKYPVGELSGGGQQKVVIGKTLFLNPDIVVVDEPTRGIDVAAKAEVLKELRRIAHEDGRAVIVTSTETEEVIDVSDRVLVMSHGRLAGELGYGDGPPTMREILDLAFGVDEVVLREEVDT